MDTVRGDELVFRRIEVAGSDQNDVVGIDRTGVDQHPQRRRPQIAAWRGLDRVEVPVRVEPDDCNSAVPGLEGLDGADVRAAATSEYERALRQVHRESQILLAEARFRDHGGLRVRERQVRGLLHRFAAFPPGSGDANEAGAELPPAGMALVVRPEGDRGVRLAVGTFGAEGAHTATGTSSSRVAPSRVRSGSSFVGCGTGSSPSRLIHTDRSPSSFAGVTSWKRLAATWA